MTSEMVDQTAGRREFASSYRQQARMSLACHGVRDRPLKHPPVHIVAPMADDDRGERPAAILGGSVPAASAGGDPDGAGASPATSSRLPLAARYRPPGAPGTRQP